jgi:hypothetical protein
MQMKFDSDYTLGLYEAAGRSVEALDLALAYLSRHFQQTVYEPAHVEWALKLIRENSPKALEPA